MPCALLHFSQKPHSTLALHSEEALSHHAAHIHFFTVSLLFCSLFVLLFWAAERCSLVGRVTKPTVNPREKLFGAKNWRGNKRQIRDFQKAFAVTSNINRVLNFMPGFCLRDCWNISLIGGILNYDLLLKHVRHLHLFAGACWQTLASLWCKSI